MTDMRSVELQYLPYLALIAGLVAARLAARRLIPLREISIVNGVFLGVLVFLGTPVLAYGREMAIGPWEWAGWVFGTTAAFLTFAAVARAAVLRMRGAIEQERWTRRASATVGLVVALYGTMRLVGFLLAGGVTQSKEILLGGTAHMQYVVSLGSKMAEKSSSGTGTIVLLLLEYLFYSSWAVLARRRRFLAAIAWTIVALSFTTEYSGRSALGRFLVVPYLAYLDAREPKARTVALQLGALSIAILVAFSWHSAIRLGQDYGLEFDRVVADTLRDAGNSGPPAVRLLLDGHSESGSEYLASLVGFAVPRALWPGKPAVQTNIVATERLTGREVGQGTSVITTTIMGEGWLHFGHFGPLVIGVLFGLTSGFVDGVLFRHPLGAGIRYVLSYLGCILVRSTFMSFFQLAAVAGASFMLARVVAGTDRPRRGRREAAVVGPRRRMEEAPS